MKKWILILVAMLPFTASAEPIRFEFNGYCTIDCSEINLSYGDEVSGFVETLTGLDDDNVLWWYELSDFGFQFGPWITIDDSTHFALGALVLSPDGSGLFGSDDFEAMAFQQWTNPSTSGLTGRIGFLDVQGWVASGQYCNEWGCAYFHLSAGPGTYTRVPEPGPLGLFGLGLVTFGAIRLRRRSANYAAALTA